MLTLRNEKRIKRQSSVSCLFMLFSLLLPFSFLSIFPFSFLKKKMFRRVRNEEKGVCGVRSMRDLRLENVCGLVEL